MPFSPGGSLKNPNARLAGVLEARCIGSKAPLRKGMGRFGAAPV